MRFRVTFAFCFVAILSAWGVLRAQKPFKEYPGDRVQQLSEAARLGSEGGVGTGEAALPRYFRVSRPPARGQCVMAALFRGIGPWTIRVRIAICWPAFDV